jgi:hypothetical protein
MLDYKTRAHEHNVPSTNLSHDPLQSSPGRLSIKTSSSKCTMPSLKRRSRSVRRKQKQRFAYSPPLPSSLSAVSQITPSFLAPDSPQDGSPFLLSVNAGKKFTDRHAQGYTVAVTSTFASKEDFEHYSTQCEARKELKTFGDSVYWEI